MSEEQLSAFVQRAQADTGLLNALSEAQDVETVAAIARGAGFTVDASDLWSASDLEPGMLPEAAPVWLDPHQSLTAFLHQVELDPWYQEALIQAPDGETVAAIARAAGYPLTAEELWAASELDPGDLEFQAWLDDSSALGAEEFSPPPHRPFPQPL